MVPFALICMEGLRPLAVIKSTRAGQGPLCPDLYGGIATGCELVTIRLRFGIVPFALICMEGLRPVSILSSFPCQG